MQYELYIDVFFLVNFMMDFLLLTFLKKMMRLDVPGFRVVLGALAGAAITCALIAIPIPWAFLKIVLFHGAVSIIMLKTGLNVKWGRELAKAYLFLYAGGFILGGAMTFFRQYVRDMSLFFALALLGYYAALGAWNLAEALVRNNQTHCTAILYSGGKTCRLKALIDTGNRLRDKATGKPVSIIAPGAACMLGFDREHEKSDGIRFISYHSIGEKAGIMPIFEIDRMDLDNGRKKMEVLRPMLAVCRDELDSDSYGMILNPDICTQGTSRNSCACGAGGLRPSKYN